MLTDLVSSQTLSLLYTKLNTNNSPLIIVRLTMAKLFPSSSFLALTKALDLTM